MPSEGTLARFVETVEGNRFLEAIEQFYAADATMQENGHPPRVGKDALLANERKVIGATRKVTARCVRPWFVSGDHAVVRWQFAFEGRDGKLTCIDELALQRWRGEKIVEEKFFYDPAQMAPASARSAG